MSDIGIGRLIYVDRKKDAIHIPVAPVEAAMDLKAGQDIIMNQEGKAEACDIKILGIVDPFLVVPVKKGDRFYVFLYPGSVDSLHHEWTHPSFIEAPPQVKGEEKVEAEAWLRNYANDVNHQITDPDDRYQTLLEDMRDGTITYHGTDMHSRGELRDPENLRKYAEIILGKPINYDDFEYFSCTC